MDYQHAGSPADVRLYKGYFRTVYMPCFIFVYPLYVCKGHVQKNERKKEQTNELLLNYISFN